VIAVTIREQRTIEAGTLGRLDGIASALAARVDGKSPYIGLKWPSGAVSFYPKRALGTLAGTLHARGFKSSCIIGRCEDGVRSCGPFHTYAEWESRGADQCAVSWGRMVLRGGDCPETVIVPLERGLEHAPEPGKLADHAAKLIKELGLAAKPEKPSEIQRLRERAAKLEREEAHLTKIVTRAKRYSTIDTTALGRAEKLYAERRTHLRDIAREMLYADERPETRFREMLAAFSPTMPAALVESALAVARIPQAHNVKRMAAAVAWHEDAAAWVDVSTGEARGAWRRSARLTYRSWAAGHKGEIKLSPTHVRDEYGRVAGLDLCPAKKGWAHYHRELDTTYSLGSLRGRLHLQQTARSARSNLAAWQTDLLKARNDLALVRVKLAQKEAKL